jgi:hypothetical protein
MTTIDADHDAELQAIEEMQEELWNVVDDLEQRGFTPNQISCELLWLATQVAKGVARSPDEAHVQVKYFRHMAESISREAAMLEKICGGVGEADAPDTALADAVTAGSA